MTNKERKDSYKAIKNALSQQKDFQRSTVDYVYDQLYKKGRNKMLVADEVGLGKTIVAKGIIAKGFKKYLHDGYPNNDNPTYNVVYICSNLAIAKQNISKLNIFNYWGNEVNANDYVEATINRLIYLSYKPKDKPPAFLINSLTPGTSFDEKSHFGESTERIIIYELLTRYTTFENRKQGLKWILKGGVGSMGNWNWYIKNHRKNAKNKIRQDLYTKFRQALLDETIKEETYPRIFTDLRKPKGYSLWKALKRISKRINNSNKKEFTSQSEIVRALRRILSRLCLEYLGADIFILDEFQRYSNLIKFDQEADNPAIELARSVFEIKDAKVLMLSATPFKPFTNDYDELSGEVHHKEFEAVLKFLMKGDPDELWEQFHSDRKAFFVFLRKIESLKANSELVHKIKSRLESFYRKSLVRTERLLVSKEHDAMIKSVLKDKPLALSKSDIESFKYVDKLILYLNEKHNTKLPIPLEYVKSSPYVLSYLDNYQHKKKLEKHAKEDKQLRGLINKTENSWLNMNLISSYGSIGVEGSNWLPNSKLRLLLDETLYKKGWQYLWVPPIIEYYKSSGAYLNSKGYSKCLVFSSWQLVPRMISSIASYEAERLTVGNPSSFTGRERVEIKRNYFAEKRSPVPQITYKVSIKDKEPEGMMNFIILYPSLFLKDILDPATHVQDDLTVKDLRAKVKKLIRKPLKQVIDKYGKGSSDWHKWMWVAPLLLDRESADKRILSTWLSNGLPDKELAVDVDDESIHHEEQSGKQIHFDFAYQVLKEPSSLSLPYLEGDKFETVLDFLVSLTLGSVSVCVIRSLERHLMKKIGRTKTTTDLLNAAFNISSAFVTLFNKPESISIIRLTTNATDYIDKVLEYSIDGNIQSMLNEYFYLLIDCDNLKSTDELSDNICDTLSIRTNVRQVDDLETFNHNLNGKRVRQKRIRTHFAADFTEPRLKTAGSDRTINIRQAFNSPFRPFILASTSIGQEGLDFHLYCKKIFHWNLPSNAIDLEQREGRIHRYKGLVIRQNLADKYVKKINSKLDIPLWEQIFDIAAGEKEGSDPNCELIPFWHTEPINENKIERFIPLYPFSKDIDRYKHMLKILAFYRLTFGQPRQEELIDAIFNGKLEYDYNFIQRLTINLSPVLFYK